MKKIICKAIWDISEFTGLGLGKLAPIIFGGMIGSKPHKTEKEDE